MTDIQSLEEARWAAVLERDERGAGSFVYAVRSTGVYCRPGCPSRRPRRDQVRFFADPAAARDAGFRACRRCLPDQEDSQRALVRSLCQLIEERLDERLDLAALGQAAGMSRFHLQRVFKRIVGVSPREYVAARRAQRFKAGLQAGEPVTAAAFDAGFGSSSTVYRPAHDLGMTPGGYQRGGAALRISYALLDSPLGPLLIGATERGVCAVALGDDAAALEEGLRREYPAAALARDDGRLAAWGAAVVSHLAGDRRALDLPLDVRGTAFQWRVWQALRAIPYGETRSYGEVARQIGQPTATRAVARACASNQVALAIPCHRVIKGDGGLGGYRWGAGRKQALLERERGARD